MIALPPSGKCVVQRRSVYNFVVGRAQVSAALLALAGLAQTPVPDGSGPAGRSAQDVVPRATARTDHLRVSYANRLAGRPGARVQLAVDVEPRPGMHVYAPGADQYKVVTLNLTERPFLRPDPVRYPASELYVFAPLNERVPVYQKPFTLLRDVRVDSSPASLEAFGVGGTLLLTGTLEYQACDDKVCFSPATVPLSWTLERGGSHAP